MKDLFFAIPTIALCSLGYYFSWRYYSKEKFLKAVLLLILCGLALRIYTASDLYLHTWDERYHAVVAKNLIQQPLKPTLYNNPILPYDYRNWAGNHIWVHKQPLPLWTMSASMYLFGINEIALRLPSIILTTIGIWLSFFIGRYFFSNRIGYLTAFFYSINGLIIEMSAGRIATDHVDIFFLFFIELAVVLSILFAQSQKPIYNILAGISIGAAILSKWLPALIILPIWLLIVIDTGKFKPKAIIIQFIILLTTCIIIFLPWQLYIFNTFPNEAIWETSFNLKHITEVLDDRTGPIYYFIERIRINYGELIYLPLLWFIWETLKNSNNKKRLAIFLIWVFVPIMFFSIAKTKMQGYILFISPALFVITSAFFFMVYDHKKKTRHKWFFNLILFLLIALPIRYMIERVKPFQKKTRNPEWAVELRKLNERNISKGVLFNYNRPIEAMFYTNLTSYQNIPDSNKIKDLLADGYMVIINDDGKIPANIRTLKGISIERFNCH